MSTEVMGVLGFILALAVLVVLVCKGMHLAYCAVITVLIITVTNGMPLMETLSNYWGTVGGIAGMFLPIFLFGAIFAKVYTNCGAASSLTSAFMDLLCRKAKNPEAEQKITIIAIAIVPVVLGYGGLDQFAMLFLLMPIFMKAMERVNIPRKFLPAFMMMGLCICCVGAGAPQQNNFLPTTLAGVSGTAALIPSIIGQIVIGVSGVTYLIRAVKKANANGENFSWGKLRPAQQPDGKQPNPILSLVPLVCVCLLYNLTSIGLSYSMLLGAIITIVLFFSYFNMEETKFKSIVASLNQGVHDAAMPILCLPAFGIGSVIAAAPGCQTLTALLEKIPGPPLVSCTLMLVLLVAVCADPKAGITVGMPIALDIYPQLGVSTTAIARIGAFSMGVLDSLPIAAGIPMVMNMCDLDFMEGYKPCFWTSVVCTGLGTLVVMIVLILFPGLAG